MKMVEHYRKKSMTALLICLLCSLLPMSAQVTSEPSPLQQSSKNVVIYYHADQGNKQLAGLTAATPIYAHTGVITNTSSSSSDWQYATPKWGDNSDKYKLEYVSENLWKLNIGSINEYYGITDPEVVVQKLAFVFRNADCSLQGKTSTGGDIFLDVVGEGLFVTMTSNVAENILMGPTTAQFTLSSTQAADLSIDVNGTVIASKSNATSISASYEFKDYGTYTVTGIAKAGSESVTAKEVYTYIAPSVKADYPGGVPQMGARRQADGSVLFCLAAPQKASSLIVGSWNDYAIDDKYAMSYQDYEGQRYFWIKVEGLDADKAYPYYYLVDGSISVGDPYAKLILDPFNDKYIPKDVYPDLIPYPTDKVDGVPLAVYQENLNDYDWQVTDFKRPAPENLIVYEMLFRDFTGTEGKADGNGTVRKAIEKFSYLKELAVNAVELLPINEFNGNISWGYNPNFYFAPDKAYGTPDDYKEFIDLCHQNGIAVILDVVFNQSDWMHPWYQLYPVGQNPFYNPDAPHAYSVLNDWNQGNPLVQKQFCDVLQYWLKEYKVDGFRFDLVKGLGNNDSYANASGEATNAYNASRVARMREFQKAMQEVDPTAYVINENLAGAKEENEMAAFGQLNWANINNEGQQYACGNSSNSNLSRFYAPNDSRKWGSTVSYLESHDEQRLAYAQNTNGVTGIKGNIPNSMRRLSSAAAQMILSPGAHMIWQFSEMGNDQSTKNSSGNDTGPKLVLWSYLDNDNRMGLHNCYKELITLRRSNNDLFASNADFKMKCQSSDWDNGRYLYSTTKNKELYTLINPNVKDVITMTVPFRSNNADDYAILSQSFGVKPVLDVAAGTVTVPANSYVVVGNLKVATGVEEIGIEPAEDNIAVAVDGNEIIVNRNVDNLQVFDAAGRMLLSTRAVAGQTFALPTGLYIVRAGSQAIKAMIN